MVEIFVDADHCIKVFESLVEMYSQEDWEFMDQDDKEFDPSVLQDGTLIRHDGTERSQDLHALMAVSDDEDEPNELWILFINKRIREEDLFRVVGHEVGHAYNASKILDPVMAVLTEGADYDTEEGHDLMEAKAETFEDFTMLIYKHIKSIQMNSFELGIEIV